MARLVFILCLIVTVPISAETIFLPAGNVTEDMLKDMLGLSIEEELRVEENETHIVGQGVYSTTIRLNNSPLRFERKRKENGDSRILFNCSLKGVRITAVSVDHAVEVIDSSEFVMEDVKIETRKSEEHKGVGVMLQGRENTTLNRVHIRADQPIFIGRNPNTGGSLSADHLHVHDAYLRSWSGPIIKIEDGANLTNVTINGRQAWVGGSHGIYNKDNSSVPVSYQLNVSGVRWEVRPAEVAGGYGIYIDRQAAVLQGLTVRDWYQDSRDGNGFYLRGVHRVSFDNVHYPGRGVIIDVDNSELVDLRWLEANRPEAIEIIGDDVHGVSGQILR